MRVRDLAQALQCAFEGDGDLVLTGAAELERANASELSFVAAEKYWKAAAASSAGCLVATPDFPAEGRTVIRSADARMTFAKALFALYPVRREAAGIHPSAVIGANVTIEDDVAVGPHVSIGDGSHIGRGSRIGAGAAIGRDVRIGEGSMLHARVSVYDRVEIGKRAVLHSGCVIGADGFGFAWTGERYQKFPQVGIVKLGDDVEIGANTTIDRAALGVTYIGNGTKLDNMVHIGHNCRVGDHVVIAAQTGFSGQVVIEDRAVIGGQVGIGDKARVESGATLGSGCGVLTSKVVRGGQVVWGTPARPLKEYLAQLAHLSRLPRLRQELLDLTARLRRLEERLEPPV